MLPGFRFLFAAIVLSMSILVFGLGAAALLRAAHEEFAANPTWRAAPEPVFAQQSETSKATIAMLRVNPPLPEPKPAVTTTAFAPIEPASRALPEAEKATAPVPETAAPTEAAKPEVRADIKQDDSTETPPAQAAEATPAPVEPAAIKVATTEAAAPAEKSEASPAASDETAPAATSDTAAPAKAEAAMAEASETPAPAPATPLQATASDPIAEKIASVGDTTAKGDDPEAAKAAKAEQRARRAERARARRRLAAQRARLARQQAPAIVPQFPPQQFPLQPPATDPFGQQQQPATPPTPRIRHIARAQ
jgi:hypothetical protein